MQARVALDAWDRAGARSPCSHPRQVVGPFGRRCPYRRAPPV